MNKELELLNYPFAPQLLDKVNFGPLDQGQNGPLRRIVTRGVTPQPRGHSCDVPFIVIFHYTHAEA